MNKIRRYFVENDQALLGYLPYDPYEHRKDRENKWKNFYSFGTGGLVRTISLLNSFIGISLTAILLPALPMLYNLASHPLILILVLVIEGVILWVAHWSYTQRYYRKNTNKILVDETQEILEASEIKTPLPIEEEEALLIWSDNPDEITAYILNLKTFDNFDVMQPTIQHIDDSYFDTPNRELEIRRLALRLRCQDNTINKITLKGPSKKNPTYSERFELEDHWSLPSITKVTNILTMIGIKTFILPPKLSLQDPEKIMAYLGLKRIQRRITTRKLIYVKDGVSGKVIIEIGVDSVEYKFDKCTPCFSELEIEAKEKGNHGMIKSIVKQLVNEYPKNFKEWPYSKLVTGKAIERLINERLTNNKGLNNYLDDNEYLTKTAFDQIEKILKREGGESGWHQFRNRISCTFGRCNKISSK